ncbi:MAG: GMC family oxidoreductase N-terminal domain-containing protein, partial [Streptosporangiaceae bacterium]
MVEFDYLVIGGGTAGCIVAARLAQDPAVSVGLVEWGPSDEHEPRARSIRRWAEMLEGEYDLDYRSVRQERGNSGIRQARLRILGGCSTANTMISWRPRVADLREWADLGAAGWDAATVHTSADPDERPSIDYRYFTDPAGADEAVLVAAVRAARRIGESEPMASQLLR